MCASTYSHVVLFGGGESAPISCYLGGVYTHIVLFGGGGVHPYRAIRGTPMLFGGGGVYTHIVLLGVHP